MSDLRASIVVIGDEILGGFVQDTNSHWLAQQLHRQGVPLDRVQTVPDTMAAIDEALRLELERPRPRLVLTTGGIGSTPDDLTMEAVAATLGRLTVVDDAIDGWISRALEWTVAQGGTVTEAHERSMRKMALVPDGSYLLAGAKGVAPGVALDIEGGLAAEGVTIVILPGVPGEMKRIYREGIAGSLLRGFGHPAHVVELTHGYPESSLNPVFDLLVEQYPDVHLGSYPNREVMVRLKGERARTEAAAQVVRDYLAELDADPSSARIREAWANRWHEDV